MMKKLLVVCLMLLAINVAHAEELWVISGEQWDRPRTGALVSKIKIIAAAVHRFDENKGLRLEINHPGGEEGSLWAYELRSWLIALGVPSDYIELLPGGVSQDLLHIQIKGEVQ
ncbi:MAG: hypothetical protein GXP22_01095 [Gammaproteobacteria bacterium]|nr:hypothetical protein [Gammaproteobacteria bacterium]